jgi:hypothetical protein
MRRQMTRMTVAALAAGMLLFPMTFGKENPKFDHYAAVLAIEGGSASGSTVSIDYPYTILQMDFNGSSEGTGTVIGAAKIRFNKKKHNYEIESYEHGTEYNKPLNVQRLKD